MEERSRELKEKEKEIEQKQKKMEDIQKDKEVEELKKKIELEEIKKKEAKRIQRESEESVRLRTTKSNKAPEKSDKEKINHEPKLSWNTLANIVRARKLKIPADPQPIVLKSSTTPPRALTSSKKSKKRKESPIRLNDSRNNGLRKNKLKNEKYINNSYDEIESGVEYLLIEEEEESESDIDEEEASRSGVSYHW